MKIPPFIRSWVTTVFGGVAGVPTIMVGLEQSNWAMVAGGVGMLLVGLFARDAGKSSEKVGAK